jgi:uncharacterized protein YjbI with pentapeptide repeats
MAEHTIKHRNTGAVLYTGDGESLRDVVEAAVSDGAYLAGAKLDGAYLAGANLGGAKLIGKRPIIQIGPIGSRSSYVVAYLTDAGVRVRAGCFFGSLDKFRAAVIKTHGESIHAREYAAAIALIEMHAECWTPAAVVSEAA